MRGEQKLSAADFQAADALLERTNFRSSAHGASRDQLREFYASMHARLGADKFALRFGLREPRTALEELDVLFMRQQITEEEHRKRYEKYATRPVDRPMLEKFFSEYEEALEEYASILQLIVEVAMDQHEPEIWRRREGEVDAAIAKFDEAYELFSTELQTVFEFLTQVQIDREEPIKCGDYTGDTAHWIATLIFSNASEAWKSCKEIAQRSERDPSYLYSTHASSLFFATWIETGKLPRPNELAALMRSERAKALCKFDSAAMRQSPTTELVARKKILFLASNPTDTGRLRLDREVRAIEEGLERANERSRFELIAKFAVRVEELRRGLLDNSPNIVHFAGHGDGLDGILMEDDLGNAYAVPNDALAGLFELCVSHVDCVILNACYSDVQADAISKHIPYVIGMKRGISDAAAQEFAIGFYDALGAGRSIQDAYRFGCNAIALKGIAEHLTPVLKKRVSED